MKFGNRLYVSIKKHSSLPPPQKLNGQFPRTCDKIILCFLILEIQYISMVLSWFYVFRWLLAVYSVFLYIFIEIGVLSQKFHLCKELKSKEDYRHLLLWIRNAFGFMAMMDYPYPTDFMGNLPTYPVKVL